MTISDTLSLLRYETPCGAAPNGGFGEADGRGTCAAPDPGACDSGHGVRSGVNVGASGRNTRYVRGMTSEP